MGSLRQRPSERILTMLAEHGLLAFGGPGMRYTEAKFRSD